MDSCVVSNLGVETSQPPPAILTGSGYWVGEGKSERWTRSENKVFENALAVFDKDTPNRWERVAELIPGKTISQVMRHYSELENDVNNIEAGLVPIPGYDTSPFTLEVANNQTCDGLKHGCSSSGKRSSSTRSDQERKKGVPWTEEEHKLFLMGLKRYGKGDWRNISRNYVITRTPTQVASHAQKYFIRQLSGGKDKRRASIHDITTINLAETQSDGNRAPSPEQEAGFGKHLGPSPIQWSQPESGGAAMVFNPHGNKRQGENQQKGNDVVETYMGSQSFFLM